MSEEWCNIQRKIALSTGRLIRYDIREEYSELELSFLADRLGKEEDSQPFRPTHDEAQDVPPPSKTSDLPPPVLTEPTLTPQGESNSSNVLELPFAEDKPHVDP